MASFWPLTSAASSPTTVLASPNTICVFSLKKSSFSMPAKPARMLRLTTKIEAALSTSRIGMPKMGLPVSWRAAGLTTSFAPSTRTTSVWGKSPLISSMSSSCS